MITHDLGRAFYQKVNVINGTPPVHFAMTHQARWPYWRAPSVIIRLPRMTALVLGWWLHGTGTLNEEELLIRSIGGRVVEDKRSPEVQRAVYVREMTAEEIADELA